MTFKEFFFTERVDPDELFHIKNPNVITFALFPKIGFIYSHNRSVDGEYMQVNHLDLYGQFPGKLLTKNKLLVSNGLVKRNVIFHLEPGKSLEEILTVTRSLDSDKTVSKFNITLEGRMYKSQVAFWCPRVKFASTNGGLFEKLVKTLNIDPHTLTYNFADVGDITYNEVYADTTASSKEDEEEMEKLRQIHLNPLAKSQVIPKNNKAGDTASQNGYKTVAQMRASRIVGDSVNS